MTDFIRIADELRATAAKLEAENPANDSVALGWRAAAEHIAALPQGIEARSGETGTGSIRQDESPVGVADAPNTVPTGQERALREALEEAKLQLAYLDDKFPTGTTPATIARIDHALALPHQPATDEGEVSIPASQVAQMIQDAIDVARSTAPSPASDTMLREAVIEECARLVETHTYTTSNTQPPHLTPSRFAKDDMHHATIAAAIRALAHSPKTEAPASALTQPEPTAQGGEEGEIVLGLRQARHVLKDLQAKNSDQTAYGKLAQTCDIAADRLTALSAQQGGEEDAATVREMALQAAADANSGYINSKTKRIVNAALNYVFAAQQAAGEAEAVAWRYTDEFGSVEYFTDRWPDMVKRGYAEQALYATPQPTERHEEPRMTDDQIKHMTERFLGWKLPENFHPDAGISFKAEYNDSPAVMEMLGLDKPCRHEPVGTNLFDAVQAEAMVRYLVEGLPATPPTTSLHREPIEADRTEHWSRQGIVSRIVKAIAEAKTDGGMAVPAGKAADDILALLAPAFSTPAASEAAQMRTVREYLANGEVGKAIHFIDRALPLPKAGEGKA